MDWKIPQTAPKDGSMILADFGWPYPVLAAWNGHQMDWSIATQQVQPVDGVWNDTYFETDWEQDSDLKRWVALPSLSNTEN